MSNKSEELISAFMDEETTAFESRMCINQMIAEQSRRARWERYHIIRDALQGNLPVFAGSEFSRDIMDNIRQEQGLNVDMTTSPKHSKYLKPLGGLALAASVAALTILGVRLFFSTDATVGPSVVAKVESDIDEDGAHSGSAASTQRWSLNTADEARMNSYLVNHAEYAAKIEMMPYVRIVGYENNRQ